jgi:hypothetical protein
MLSSHKLWSPVDSCTSEPTPCEVVPCWHEWIMPSLSICCFIHCVGMALLAPLLPTALAFLGENEWYEGILWSVSTVGASLALWKQQPRITYRLIGVWGTTLIVGVGGLAFESEVARQAGLAGMVGIQLWLLRRRRRVHQETCGMCDAGGCYAEEDRYGKEAPLGPVA